MEEKEEGGGEGVGKGEMKGLRCGRRVVEGKDFAGEGGHGCLGVVSW